MLERKIQVGGEIVLHPDRTLDFQIRLLKIGVPLNTQLPAASHRIEVEVSGAFLVESEIAEMNVRFDRRLLRCTAGVGRKIDAAPHREPAGLEFGEMDEIQIASGEIQPKLLAGNVHGGRSEERRVGKECRSRW